MFKKSLRFLVVPTIILTAASSSFVANRLIERNNNDENNVSILNNSFRSSATVSNWEEFSNAASNASVEEISLSGDIDLSNATEITEIVDKKIVGNGYSFVNREINQESKYLIGTAINVTFDNVQFDNVEMFIDDYIITDSTDEAIVDPLFNNVGIFNMTFDSLDLNSLNDSNFNGMFINNSTITVSNSASFSGLPLINGLIVDSANVNVTSAPETLGVATGSFNVTATGGALSDGLDGYIAKTSLANSTFNLGGSDTNVSLLGSSLTSGFEFVLKGAVISGVEVTGGTSSTLELIRGVSTLNGDVDYVASMLNTVNGSSESTGIISSATSSDFRSTSNVANIGPGVTDTTDVIFGTGANISYSNSSDEDAVLREERITTSGLDFGVVRTILNETFGSASYSVSTVVEEEIEYFDGIVLFSEKTILINDSEGEVSGSKIGELILNFSYFNESSSPIPYPLFVNSTFEVGNKTFDAVNAKDDDPKISFDFDTKQYSMKINLKGLKKSTLEKEGAIFRSTMTYESDSARVTKTEEIEIYISGSSIFENFDQNDVVFLSVAGLIFTILFAIILLILILLLIWWLIKRKQKRDAIARVDGVNSGYYRYVQNEPVEIPADPNLHDYDNQFGDYSTGNSDDGSYDNQGYSNYDYDNQNSTYDDTNDYSSNNNEYSSNDSYGGYSNDNGYSNDSYDNHASNSIENYDDYYDGEEGSIDEYFEDEY